MHFLVFPFLLYGAGRNHSTPKKCLKVSGCFSVQFCVVLFCFPTFLQSRCLCRTVFSSFRMVCTAFFSTLTITRTPQDCNPCRRVGKFFLSDPARTENFYFRFRKHFLFHTQFFHIDLLKSYRFFCAVCAPFGPQRHSCPFLTSPAPAGTFSPERHTHATNQTDLQTVQDRRSRAECAEQCQPEPA